MPVKMSRLSIQRLPNQLLPNQLFSALTCITCLLSAPAYSNPIYADDFDADLPPVPDGIDTSLHTGVWLLSFTDVGIYESADYDGNITRTEVSATGRVYSVIAPTSVDDPETDTTTYDHSRPRALDLSCLPFYSSDGGSKSLEDWSGSYEQVNYYYNPITDSETETGSLSIEINGAELKGRGVFRQHPAGFGGRFNTDNLIAHSIGIRGIKISDNASVLENEDFETNISSSCFGAIQKTTVKDGESEVETVILPAYWQGTNEQIINPPYFDGYDFYAEIFSAEQGTTDSYTLILK
ncbi:hypothetical protein NBRC116585_09060 [Thalassolituus maritimus]|uniref:Secreted protein n=2 Tax=Thalassolituus maritimus TaxID=484498 RepID=A0ABP9ZXC4_9GAMM